MLIQLVATALVVGHTSPAAARPAVDTIAVGHAALRGRTIPLGTDTTEVFIERDGKLNLVNTSIEEITKTSEGILVVFVGKGRNAVSIDSIVLSPTTLAPIRHVEVFPGKRASYTYGRGRLTGASTDSTGEHKVDTPIRDGVFDFSVAQQVLRMLPLRAGYEAVVLSYDVAQMKERPVGFQVIGQERLTINDREQTAWKTVMDVGTHKVTIWVDGATRRDLKFDVTLPNMHMVAFRK